MKILNILLSLLFTVSFVYSINKAKEVTRDSNTPINDSEEFLHGNSKYVLFDDKDFTWNEAKDYCSSIGGHLATITSKEEQDFITENVLNTGTKYYYWIGGYRDDSNNWKWITDEEFSYSNWVFGQPDNANNNENKLMIYKLRPSTFSPEKAYGYWNNLNESGNYSAFFGVQTLGFICEWDNKENVQNEGTLPEDISNLKSLKVLELFNNKLSGQFPSSINELLSLEHLDLRDNNFSGTIPSFENMTSLQSIALSRNNFSGSIPSSIGNLTNLLVLYLQDNNLDGSIPSTIGNLSKLRYLHLENNRLSNSIPSSIGNLNSLEFLYLDNNNLNGTIPSEIVNLSKLVSFILSNNDLNGEIPTSELEKLSLAVIDLENNHGLWGEIPDIKYYNDSYIGNIKCKFGGTSLCYSKMNEKYNCIYPETKYNCTTCIENSEIINNVYKCKKGFRGIGYIKCEDSESYESECQFVNSLLGKEKSNNCCDESGITCTDNFNIIQ
eukprot:jgi/Orpsp1_1/1182752/evm.model.c7180000082552.1